MRAVRGATLVAALIGSFLSVLGAVVIVPVTGAAASGTVTLSVHDFAFSPATLTITAGTTVRITNTGTVAHTWSSDPGDGTQWDSGILNPGASFSMTFDSAGRFGFHCNVHPFMTGTIVVNPSAPPTTARPAPTTVKPAPAPPKPQTPTPTKSTTPAPLKPPTPAATPSGSPTTSAPPLRPIASASPTTATPPINGAAARSAPVVATTTSVQPASPTSAAASAGTTPTTLGTASAVTHGHSSNTGGIIAIVAIGLVIGGGVVAFGIRRRRRRAAA